MIQRISGSRKQSYESGIDKVLKVWRLNSQSGTQEVPKIGHNVLIENLGRFHSGIHKNWELGVRTFNIAKRWSQNETEKF